MVEYILHFSVNYASGMTKALATKQNNIRMFLSLFHYGIIETILRCEVLVTLGNDKVDIGKSRTAPSQPNVPNTKHKTVSAEQTDCN